MSSEDVTTDPTTEKYQNQMLAMVADTTKRSGPLDALALLTSVVPLFTYHRFVGTEGRDLFIQGLNRAFEMLREEDRAKAN